MDSLGGGGGQTGGAIVQQTAPWASYAAGQLGATAARAASDTYTQQLNNAILGMNQQYASAISGMRPYTQTGIEALDKLNQYLGLNPYVPTAPTAPKAPNLDEYMKKVTSAQINDYINSNTNMQMVPNQAGQEFYFPVYTGEGAYNNIPQTLKNGPSGTTQLGTGLYKDLGGIVGASTNVMSPYGQFSGNKQVQELARKAIANQMLQNADPSYQAALTAYNNDLDTYNKAKAWAEQYGTPLTQEQITQNITSTPGYSAELNQGIDAISKMAGAGGYVGSGRALKELMSYGQNTLSKYYNQTLNNLGQVAAAGQQASTTSGGYNTQFGNNLAQLYNSLGENQANSILAAAGARSNALVNANQQYSVIGQQSNGGGLGGLGSLLGGLGAIGQGGGLKGIFKLG